MSMSNMDGYLDLPNFCLNDTFNQNEQLSE